MPVPNTFASATSAIPLANLDTNFATPITLGNTAVQLGNTITTINNVTITGSTLTTANVASGNVANSITLGTTAGDNASAGYVGEYVSSQVLFASAVSLTTSTYANITSISLTAGDWDVGGIVYFSGGTTTVVNQLIGSIGTTSANLGSSGSYWIEGFASGGTTVFNTQDFGQTVPTTRFSLSSTTTIYLVGLATFTVSTAKTYGLIRARRMR